MHEKWAPWIGIIFWFITQMKRHAKTCSSDLKAINQFLFIFHFVFIFSVYDCLRLFTWLFPLFHASYQLSLLSLFHMHIITLRSYAHFHNVFFFFFFFFNFFSFLDFSSFRMSFCFNLIHFLFIFFFAKNNFIWINFIQIIRWEDVHW